jgi:DNA-binding NarL/FixJ family response regulator
MPDASRTLLVVATESLVRSGIVALLSRSFSVVDAVGTLREANQALSRYAPSLCVLLFDPPLPDAGLDETSQLIREHPRTRTLALFRPGAYAQVSTACRYGARGFFDTSVPAAELQAALEQMRGGGVAVHPPLLDYIVNPQHGADTTAGNGTLLTETQLRSLDLLANGYSSKEIARITGMTMAAVNHSIERATKRLGASHRTQAVANAIKLGLVGRNP